MGRARTPTPPRPGTPTTTIPILGRPRTPMNFGHSASHINSNTRTIVNSNHIVDSNNVINVENSVESSNIGRAHRENVQVVVRCRPMSEKETAAGFQSCVSIDTKLNAVQIHNGGGRNSAKYTSRIFTFDHTYDETCTQKQLYDDVAKPIVHSVMCGYNGTILAYGQTASGKTYTMEGLDHPSDHWGIVPNACQQIFDHIKQSESSVQFLVRASFLEIYNEEIWDLLAPCLNARLELKESVETGVYVKNLTSLTVNSFADINRLLMKGKKNRSVGATAMNQDSSRSHSIFTITVETSSLDKSSRGHSHIKVGKLNLVDLAGSERFSKTGTTGERFKEMTKINWSLSALGNVISALVDGKSSHIPYRDSKLTRLLQDSLGGNTRTVMVANIGPADYNYEESVGTLRYANRAKSIRNKPHVNEDPKDAIIREYQDEIHRLKAQLSTIPGQDSANQIRMLEQEKNMHMEKYRAKILDVTGSQNMSDSVSASLEAQLKLESLRAEKERSDEENEKVVNSLRQKLLEMELQNQALVRGTEDRTLLERKLKVLEEKLLCGTAAATHNAHGLDIPRQQENDIYQVMQRVDEEKQIKITELEEAQLMAEEKCNTLEEEVESKTQKLKILINCYQQSKIEISSLKAEIQDNMYESHQEKEDLLRSLKCLDQQHQLKSLIIERFIPPEEVAKIMRNIQWDEEGEKWVMRKIQPHFASAVKNPSQRPASAVGCSRPTCHWALKKLSSGTTDPRFLEQNILKLDLEAPMQTTYDYNDPMDRAQGEREIHKCLKQIKHGSPYYSYNMQILPKKKSAVSRPKPLLSTQESLFSRSVGH